MKKIHFENFDSLVKELEEKYGKEDVHVHQDSVLPTLYRDLVNIVNEYSDELEEGQLIQIPVGVEMMEFLITKEVGNVFHLEN